jgi:hypothetical protein
MHPPSLIIYPVIILFILPVFSQQDPDFNQYFYDQTMRIDYFHIGDNKTEIITIDQIYLYGIWAGNKKNMIDNFNNGCYYVKIYDLSANKLIYSKGFDSFFREYTTTDKAEQGILRTYHESVLIPAPKAKVLFSLEKRDKQNNLELLFKREIDPLNVDIIREDITDQTVKIFNHIINGTPDKKVDIVILGEGYSNEKEEKYQSDLKRFSDLLLNSQPYKSYLPNFNIYGVLKFSRQSGADEPRAGVYKNTVLNTTFNSLGSERYLMTEDNKSLRDISAAVPYDAIYIMVNHKRYGGGGIYNLYCTFTSDNQWSEYLFLHEFGHSFAGLADEYYTSDITYNDFFPQGVEPVEPNITAMLDPANIKWKSLLSDGLEIPTPWEKEEFDQMDYQWQKERRGLNTKIAELKKNKASQEEIAAAEKEYAEKDLAHAQKVERYLRSCKNWGKVGVFEGAGYMAKGLYRPMINCIMFSKINKSYCRVCEEAIIRMIKYYSE